MSVFLTTQLRKQQHGNIETESTEFSSFSLLVPFGSKGFGQGLLQSRCREAALTSTAVEERQEWKQVAAYYVALLCPTAQGSLNTQTKAPALELLFPFYDWHFRKLDFCGATARVHLLTEVACPVCCLASSQLPKPCANSSHGEVADEVISFIPVCSQEITAVCQETSPICTSLPDLVPRQFSVLNGDKMRMFLQFKSLYSLLAPVHIRAVLGPLLLPVEKLSPRFLPSISFYVACYLGNWRWTSI